MGLTHGPGLWAWPLGLAGFIFNRILIIKIRYKFAWLGLWAWPGLFLSFMLPLGLSAPQPGRRSREPPRKGKCGLAAALDFLAVPDFRFF